MDIYKLSYEELLEVRKEFNKTTFGRFAFVFTSYCTVVCFILFVLLGCFNVICEIFEEEVFISFSSLFIAFSINISLLVIMQLQYMNMLKDYVKSRKVK